MIEFEFDEIKSKNNISKHGIDFHQIQGVWDDPDVIEIPAKVKDEPRFLVVGKSRGKHWSVIITYRQQKIRIISARRATPQEVVIYES